MDQQVCMICNQPATHHAFALAMCQDQAGKFFYRRCPEPDYFCPEHRPGKSTLIEEPHAVKS